MQDIYHNRPLTQSQQITILCYVVEINTNSAPYNPNNDGKTTQTFRFTDSNPITARQKAFKRLLMKEKRLTEGVGTPGIAGACKGLKLYLEYHKNYDENVTGI